MAKKYYVAGVPITDELHHSDGYYGIAPNSRSLKHYGVKGMSWYSNRWYDEDGNLTDAGRRRLGIGKAANATLNPNKNRPSLNGGTSGVSTRTVTTSTSPKAANKAASYRSNLEARRRQNQIDSINAAGRRQTEAVNRRNQINSINSAGQRQTDYAREQEGRRLSQEALERGERNFNMLQQANAEMGNRGKAHQAVMAEKERADRNRMAAEVSADAQRAEQPALREAAERYEYNAKGPLQKIGYNIDQGLNNIGKGATKAANTVGEAANAAGGWLGRAWNDATGWIGDRANDVSNFWRNNITGEGQWDNYNNLVAQAQANQPRYNANANAANQYGANYGGVNIAPNFNEQAEAEWNRLRNGGDTSLFGQIGQAARNVGNWVGTAAGNVGDWANGAVNNVGQFFGNVGQGVNDFWRNNITGEGQWDNYNEMMRNAEAQRELAARAQAAQANYNANANAANQYGAVYGGNNYFHSPEQYNNFANMYSNQADEEYNRLRNGGDTSLFGRVGQGWRNATGWVGDRATELGKTANHLYNQALGRNDLGIPYSSIGIPYSSIKPVDDINWHYAYTDAHTGEPDSRSLESKLREARERGANELQVQRGIAAGRARANLDQPSMNTINSINYDRGQAEAARYGSGLITNVSGMNDYAKKNGRYYDIYTGSYSNNPQYYINENGKMAYSIVDPSGQIQEYLEDPDNIKRW